MSIQFGLLWKIIRQNGGIWGSIKSLYIRDSLKIGTLVGIDDYGNRYYENNNYFIPRNRWVCYADHVYLNYDSSQVPAEWYGWLHHRTDLPPSKEPFRPKYPWMARHEENKTGTRDEYVPYTTTRPKILPWKPPKECDQTNPLKSASMRKEAEMDGDCDEPIKGKQPPPECEDEDNSAPPQCKEGSAPPKCETKEVIEGCDERVETKDPRSKCEKPVSAFH